MILITLRGFLASSGGGEEFPKLFGSSSSIGKLGFSAFVTLLVELGYTINALVSRLDYPLLILGNVGGFFKLLLVPPENFESAFTLTMAFPRGD